ncbi:cell envelope integrity protein TolA [Parachitinimonas caeni]|uniref:TonB family protein n=1 Tax=Parachitinimonas caeni TaxID=3031301 RepID=A0ABT7DR18_9NEIS|nr:TonB family protein [Parachitinimonas caeni]MDK2122527.1 TonB family protein [Parachitinimonas caeni]
MVNSALFMQDASLGLMSSTTLNVSARSDQWLIGAVAFSIALHGLVIFGLRFSPPDPRKLLDRAPLDIILVNSKSQTAPEKPDALAQVNLDGGGNTDAENRRVKTPLPVDDNAEQSEQVTQVAKRQIELEQQQSQLMTQLKLSPNQVLVNDAKPQPHTQPVEGINVDAERLRAQQIAKLEGEISRRIDEYQTKPRKAFVGARTKGVVEARYVDDWRIKIERIGNLNYPKASNGERLYGQLRITVEIRTDGSVSAIEVNRSSGNPVLDESAKRIVQLASPFPRLPAGIVDNAGKPADILSITRTWRFTRGDNSLDD